MARHQSTTHATGVAKVTVDRETTDLPIAPPRDSVLIMPLAVLTAVGIGATGEDEEGVGAGGSAHPGWAWPIVTPLQKKAADHCGECRQPD